MHDPTEVLVGGISNLLVGAGYYAIALLVGVQWLVTFTHMRGGRHPAFYAFLLLWLCAVAMFLIGCANHHIELGWNTLVPVEPVVAATTIHHTLFWNVVQLIGEAVVIFGGYTGRLLIDVRPRELKTIAEERRQERDA
jgi:hypothetical protein